MIQGFTSSIFLQKVWLVSVDDSTLTKNLHCLSASRHHEHALFSPGIYKIPASVSKFQRLNSCSSSLENQMALFADIHQKINATKICLISDLITAWNKHLWQFQYFWLPLNARKLYSWLVLLAMLTKNTYVLEFQMHDEFVRWNDGATITRNFLYLHHPILTRSLPYSLDNIPCGFTNLIPPVFPLNTALKLKETTKPFFMYWLWVFQ